MGQVIDLSEIISVPPTGMDELLVERPGVAFGEPTGTTDVFADTLSVRFGEGAKLSQAVLVGVEGLDREHGCVRVRLNIRAADHDGRFPSFAGALEVRAVTGGTELRLAGTYSPPHGVAGRLGGLVVGHRAAGASMQAFLTVVAQRLEHAVSTATEVQPGSPPEHPEIHIG